MTPGIPKIPEISALTRFISSVMPKLDPIRFTRNRSTKPTAVLIRSLKIRRIGAERILSSAKITSTARTIIRTELKAFILYPLYPRKKQGIDIG